MSEGNLSARDVSAIEAEASVFVTTTFEVEIMQRASTQAEADAMPAPESDEIERILDLELAHLGIHRVIATRR